MCGGQFRPSREWRGICKEQKLGWAAAWRERHVSLLFSNYILVYAGSGQGKLSKQRKKLQVVHQTWMRGLSHDAVRETSRCRVYRQGGLGGVPHVVNRHVDGGLWTFFHTPICCCTVAGRSGAGRCGCQAEPRTCYGRTCALSRLGMTTTTSTGTRITLVADWNRTLFMRGNRREGSASFLP